MLRPVGSEGLQGSQGLAPQAHTPTLPLQSSPVSSQQQILTQQSRPIVQSDVSSLQPPAAATGHKDSCQTAFEAFQSTESRWNADGMQKAWQPSKEQALKPQRCVSVCVPSWTRGQSQVTATERSCACHVSTCSAEIPHS